MKILRAEGSLNADWVPRLCTHRGQPYAILSHRWLGDANDEVLYADIEEIDRSPSLASPGVRQTVIKNPHYVGTRPVDKAGFQKLRGAAQQALNHGYDYVWIDTCCIDKNSSAELSEAINSMWSWYSTANICFAYLADVDVAQGESTMTLFAKSQWWTRGWTLQELLAPQSLTFFSATWWIIGRKKDMDIEISGITGINPNIINGTLPLESISVAQRMSWASARTTTRDEDIAYCLMGLFNVNMPLLYGEGKAAFLRLQKEIMKDSDDETTFAWKAISRPSHVYNGLLATHPSAFAAARRVVRYQDTGFREPFSMTNKGLSISLQLAVTASNRLFRANLHCGNAETGKHISIYLEKISETSEQYARVHCHEWAPPASDTETKARSIYVKQFFEQNPVYKPLNPIKSSVRLLQLIPTADASMVRARLIEADIDTARYTVLSYSWVDPASRRSIWVNNQLFEVEKALFGFLQKACADLRDDLFWVDAICIDRASFLEMG